VNERGEATYQRGPKHGHISSAICWLDGACRQIIRRTLPGSRLTRPVASHLGRLLFPA
jgi:hypothetical protein